MSCCQSQPAGPCPIGQPWAVQVTWHNFQIVDWELLPLVGGPPYCAPCCPIGQAMTVHVTWQVLLSRVSCCSCQLQPVAALLRAIAPHWAGEDCTRRVAGAQYSSQQAAAATNCCLGALPPRPCAPLGCLPPHPQCGSSSYSPCELLPALTWGALSVRPCAPLGKVDSAGDMQRLLHRSATPCHVHTCSWPRQRVRV
jgi:hypothetical protein